MTLPTISLQSTRTTNFATTYTTTIPIASIPKGSCAFIAVVGAAGGATPTVTVANHTSGKSITTEDGSATAPGAVSVASDRALLSNDSTQGAWLFSVRVDDWDSGTTDVDIIVNANGIGANDRGNIYVVPATYGIIPTRANRVAAKFIHNNTGTGSGTYNLAREVGGVVPTTVPCIAICAFRSASGAATDQTVDFDHSGVFETSASTTGFGDGTNGSGRVTNATSMQDSFATAVWDIGATTISGSGGIDLSLSTTPGAQKAFVGVLYKIGTPPPPGGTVTESETVWPMGPFPGQTVTEQEIVQPAVTPGGSVTESETPNAHSTLPHGTGLTEAESVNTGQVFSAGFGVTESEIVYQAVGYDIIEGTDTLDPPRSSPFRLVSLVANLYCRPGDVGYGRIALLDGATVIDETVWTVLTSTPTLLTLPITGTVSGPNNLRIRWGERASTLDSVVMFIEDVDLNVEYWVAESETVNPHGALPAPGQAVSEQESVNPHGTLPASGGTVVEAEVLRQHQPLPGQHLTEEETLNPSGPPPPPTSGTVTEQEQTNGGQTRTHGSGLLESELVFASAFVGKSVTESELPVAGQTPAPHGGTVVEAEAVYPFTLFGKTVTEAETVNPAQYFVVEREVVFPAIPAVPPRPAVWKVSQHARDRWHIRELR